jgi:hypothetical protein
LAAKAVAGSGYKEDHVKESVMEGFEKARLLSLQGKRKSILRDKLGEI